jgi:hypothetical protein
MDPWLTGGVFKVPRRCASSHGTSNDKQANCQSDQNREMFLHTLQRIIHRQMDETGGTGK